MYYKLRYNSKNNLMSFEFVDKSKCFDYYIGDVQVTFVKVFNDVDVVIKSNMKGILDGNNIKLYGEVKLEYGLYLLMKFSFVDINVNYGNETNAEDHLLSFLYKENTFLEDKKLYWKIIEKRNYEFTKTKVLAKGCLDTFDVIIFCKNLLISHPAIYGEVEVCPDDYLDRNNEIKYMENFFSKRNFSPKYDYDFYSKTTPVAVFRVINIVSSDFMTAQNYAISKCEVVKNIYSALLRSNGEFFALTILNTHNKTNSFYLFKSRYKGNLFLFADQVYNISHYNEALSKSENQYMQLYFHLLNEAINEDDNMMKYYRYWNILETVARDKNYSARIIKNWSGNSVRSKKGRLLKIGDGAIDIVYELLRENFSSKISENNFLDNTENFSTIKEFLNVCYQRRCCCVHNGGCFINNLNICDLKSSKKVFCRHFRILHPELGKDFEDRILTKLEMIIPEILLNELCKNSGYPSFKSSYLDEILSANK